MAFTLPAGIVLDPMPDIVIGVPLMVMVVAKMVIVMVIMVLVAMMFVTMIFVTMVMFMSMIVAVIMIMSVGMPLLSVIVRHSTSP